MKMFSKNLKPLFTAAMTLALLAPATSHAARFANQFVEFELPAMWQCNLEGAEWVCQNTNEQRKRDAIIVLAAKLKGEQDSLDQYLAYLKGVKAYTSVQGKPMKSEPKYGKIIPVNNHDWVDSLHLESELPGFYTRYLATVKQDIGVLVTYSINKDKYTQYLDDFDNLVKTLKVFRKAGGLNVKSADSDLFKNTSIPGNLAESSVFPAAAPQGGSDAPVKTKKKSDDTILYIGGGLAIALLLIIMRKRRQG